MASGPGRHARFQTTRKDKLDPHHPGPPASLRAPLLCPIRRHRGTDSRRTAPVRREACFGSVHREVPLVGKETAATICEGHHRLVAGNSALLRRFAAGADMGVLAAGAALLSS